MRSPSTRIGHAFDRMMAQRRWVSVLHFIALPVVTLAYWFGDIVPIPAHLHGRGGLVFFSSSPGWIPVLVSWMLVRNPNEDSASFRTWQFMFVLGNIFVCLVYLGFTPFASPPVHLGWSVLHALWLVGISPLARGSDASVD